jgi:protochlorophyllide reductase
MQKANEAADKIRTNIANDADDAVAAISMLKSLKLVPMACDLADLTSVDSFVKQLSGEKFDAVCYNAGIARNTEAKDVARTKQGFELTVGENVTF